MKKSNESAKRSSSTEKKTQNSKSFFKRVFGGNKDKQIPQTTRNVDKKKLPPCKKVTADFGGNQFSHLK